MRNVIIESPYIAMDTEGIRRNVQFACACMHDCLMRGEAPFASHLLYTQPGVLSDDDELERQLGIEAGLSWGAKADATVVYLNLGLSKGMQQGITRASEEGRPVEFRILETQDDFDK